MFLLDTIVLSELRKPRHKRGRNLAQWIGKVSSRDLFVSVVTIGEIERGIERQRQLDASSLGVWLDTVLRTYERRILPVDIAVARRWGRLSQGIGNKAGESGERIMRRGGLRGSRRPRRRFCA
jgi:predicted nucleic acid-binding protein